MSKKVLERGVIDQTFYVKLRDSGTNLGKTGLTASTSGLQAFYVRDRATAQTVSLSALTLPTDAHSDGGFVEVLTSMRGMYRFDAPDAPFAVGSSGVVFQLSGATGMLDCEWEVELVDAITTSNPLPAQTVSFAVGATAALQARFNEYGALRPSVSGRLLDVSAGGEAGIDWANIGSPTTAVDLTQTRISGVLSFAPPGPTTQDIWSYSPGRLVTGVVGNVTGSVGSVTGAVGSVTGAVGSVTGNVGGNVTGSIGSIASSGILISSLQPEASIEIADRVLRRGLSNVEAVADTRSLAWGVAKLVNKVAISTNTLTVNRTDDTTSLFSQAVTTSGGALPIIEADTN